MRRNLVDMNRVGLLIMLLVGGIVLSCSRQDKVVSPVFRLEGTVIPADSLQNGYVVILLSPIFRCCVYDG